MKPDVNERVPMFPLLAGLTAGIVLWGYGASWAVCGAVAAVAAAAITGCALAGRTVAGSVAAAKARPFCLALLFVAIGIASGQLNGNDTLDGNEETEWREMTVARVEKVKERPHGQSLTVRLEQVSHRDGSSPITLRNSRAQIYGSGTHLHPGDRFSFFNFLEPVSDDPNTQRAGYAAYLRGKGINRQCRVVTEDITPLEPCHDFRWLCSEAQRRGEALIDASGAKPGTCAFLKTVLLGSENVDNREAREALRDAGVSHILAVSGLHIGIIASFLLLLTSPLVLLRRPALRWATVFALTWMYVCVCGLHVPAMRAALMTTMVLAARVFQRHNSPLNALCLAAAVILLFSPTALFDAGLQMSVLCVAVLIAFTRGIFPPTEGRPPKWRRVAYGPVASLFAVFGLWPLTAYYFHSFPLMFLPANFILLPLLPFYLVIGAGAIAATSLGIPHGWLTGTLDAGYDAMISLCRTLGEGTAPELHVAGVTVLLWCAGLLVLMWAVRQRRKAMPLAAAGAILCVATGSVWFVEAPQPADGIIVQSYYGETTIMEYSGASERKHTVPEGRETALRIGRRNVVVTASKKRLGKPERPGGCDILVVRPGEYEDPEKMLERTRPRMVAVRPGVPHYRTEDIRSRCQYRGIPCHDMSVQGPLRLLEE